MAICAFLINCVKHYEHYDVHPLTLCMLLLVLLLGLYWCGGDSIDPLSLCKSWLTMSDFTFTTHNIYSGVWFGVTTAVQ